MGIAMSRVLMTLSVLSVAMICEADEPSPEQAKFFETKIRPVLVNSCYECHSKKTGQNEGGLTLDTKVGVRQGGNSGPGVVAKKLDDSQLWLAVTHHDPDSRMPPNAKLPARAIADIKQWIEMGAPDPRDDGLPSVVTSKIDIQQGRQFWSFQKPKKTAPPAVASEDWSRTAVDRFVKAKLNASSMKPSSTAEPATLLRRLHFDLIGLPPQPSDVARFQTAWKRNTQQAIQAEVDRLLESRHFGERWGRHWLDVARYAESNGKQSNQSFPFAWKYRDFVIDSFNDDMPFDRFVQQQVAGDLLPATTNAARQEGIIATGYLAIGPKDLREKSFRQFSMDVVDEQIDATTQGVLGLTVACARCHDHKSDPIPTADYYALAGVFLSSQTHYGTFGGGKGRNASDLIALPVSGSSGERLSRKEIAATKKRLEEIESQLRDFRNNKRARMEDREAPSTEPETGKTRKRRSPKGARSEQSELQAKLESLDIRGVIKEFGMGMQDRDVPVNANILIRGEVDSPAQQVPRGFPQVLNHKTYRIHNERSGRLELAQWLTSKQNPLTARVLVNRVWDKLFGRGLVSTTNNFGTTGMAPSHPELLDHLAVQFMDDGWSVKSLIRRLVLTRTYQASSDFDTANYAHDPDNKLLWRATPRRLDAEAIRDAMLTVTGQLNTTRPTGSRVNDAGDVELGRKSSPNLMIDLPPVRSVYLPAVRNGMPDLIQLFDGADPDIVTGHRDVSNAAGQALYLMNNPFVLDQADAFAKQLQQESGGVTDQVRLAFLKAFGRPPTDTEIQNTARFYKRFVPAAMKESGNRQQAEWMFLTSVCQGLLSSAEFRFLN